VKTHSEVPRHSFPVQPPASRHRSVRCRCRVGSSSLGGELNRVSGCSAQPVVQRVAFLGKSAWWAEASPVHDTCRQARGVTVDDRGQLTFAQPDALSTFEPSHRADRLLLAATFEEEPRPLSTAVGDPTRRNPRPDKLERRRPPITEKREVTWFRRKRDDTDPPLTDCTPPSTSSSTVASLQSTAAPARDGRLAVIDTETTGLTNADRIVEVAAVVINQSGTVIDEYDTLINPQRDVGPTSIHGITASMVSAAPTFEEVAASLALRIDGAVLVAHNLVFDTRFMANEYRQLGATLEPGRGFCTLRLSGERLDMACRRFGIPLEDHHRALADARASASLLTRLLDDDARGLPANVVGLGTPLSPRTLRREGLVGGYSSALLRVVGTARYPTANGALLAYLDMLDRVLDDAVITQVEHASLTALARDIGLSSRQVADAHEAYFNQILVAAHRDGMITSEERCLLDLVATALGIDPSSIPSVTFANTEPAALSSYPPGTRICFTGSALTSDGRPMSRGRLEIMAAEAGYQPVGGVTKKGCDLLVAADPVSMSGKARKARSWGIPILDAATFCDEIDPSNR